MGSSAVLDWCNEFVFPLCVKCGTFGPEKKFKRFQQDEKSTQENGYTASILFGKLSCIGAGEKFGGTEYESEPLVVKLMLPKIERRPFSEMIFMNEITMYKQIIPFFSKYDQSIGNLFPKYYFGELCMGGEMEEGAIIMEDLKANQFSSCRQKTFLDYDHLSLILRSLGKFHGMSYYLKQRNPDTFFYHTEHLVETFFLFSDQFQELISTTAVVPLRNLIQDPTYKHAALRVWDISQNSKSFFRQVYRTPHEPMAVLNHGDFLRNNLLFKYDARGKPVQVKLLDVGSARYCSPAVDVANLLYFNSDQETRNEYWDRLIEDYYRALCSVIPDKYWVPRKEDIIREFKFNALHAYMCTSYFLPIALRIEEEGDAYDPADEFSKSADSDNDKMCTNYCKMVERCVNKKRLQAMTDVLKDMIDRRFLEDDYLLV